MPLISVIINADTRDGFENETSEMGQMFDGCKSLDFLIDGVKNKIKFFEGFDTEIILYIDKHKEIPYEALEQIRTLTDTLVIRKHTDEVNFNDWNYWRAFSMASGDIVCHVDQDTACFTESKEYVQELIDNLNNHVFVSYPSHWTPNPTHDDSFQNKYWASTRLFICKREALKLDELKKCIEDPEWMYEKYGDSSRRCNWVEHYISKINGNDVFYPPVELHKGAIFSWSKYKQGTLKMLNEIPYEGVKQWILHMGGITYPVDVKCD